MHRLFRRIACAIRDRSSAGAEVVVGDRFVQCSGFASKNAKGIFISPEALTWRVVALQMIFGIPHAEIQKTGESQRVRILALDMLVNGSAFRRIEPTRQNAEMGGTDDVEDRPRTGDRGYPP